MGKINAVLCLFLESHTGQTEKLGIYSYSSYILMKRTIHLVSTMAIYLPMKISINCIFMLECSCIGKKYAISIDKRKIEIRYVLILMNGTL